MSTRALGCSAILILALGANANTLFASVVADSVADFSGVQGQGNWYYGYFDRTVDGDPYTVNKFRQMTQFLPGPSFNFGCQADPHNPAWFVQDGSYWTSLWVDGGHPNGTNSNIGGCGGNPRLPFEQWAIRRWVSTVSGQIDIDGQIGWATGWETGSGVVGHVFVDGVEVFSHSVARFDARVPYSVVAQVNAGSYVDFAIDPNGVDVSDQAYFTATITPEPYSVALLAVCLPMLARRRRPS